jgi:116 kDa U5 small nuclear ribonucleoprotein component
MASLEDYDEFGNYIGADLDSDDEADVPDYDISAPPVQPSAGAARPLEGFDEDDEPAEQNALMEIDGWSCSRRVVGSF